MYLRFDTRFKYFERENSLYQQQVAQVSKQQVTTNTDLLVDHSNQPLTCRHPKRFHFQEVTILKIHKRASAAR